MRTARSALLTIALLASGLVACDSDSPVDAPDEPGPHGVGHHSFTAVDPARGDRSILVDVWYPVDAADWQDTPRTLYPLAPLIDLESDAAVDGLPVAARAGQTLIVFSHGYGGINTQSVSLMEALASHGFIVVSPEHTGNAQASLTDSFDEAAANRVPDVSFLIDTMIARNRDPADPFYDRLDEAHIGVVGHSFGGMTSIGSAAGWAGAPPDPRVAAIVPISAVIDADLQSTPRTGPNAGFTPTQLADIDIPVMLMGGTEDLGVLIENNALAFDQLTSSPQVYRVDIIGATHTHFANICDIGNRLIELGIEKATWPAIGAGDLVAPYDATCLPGVFPIDEATRLQNLYVVAFFKRHLLGHSGYERFLSEDYAADEPAIDFWRRPD